MNIGQKLDNIELLVKKQSDKMDCMDDKIQKISTVLGGSGLGDKGLIEQMTSLKHDYYKTKQEVNKLTWLGGLIGTAIVGAMGYVYKKLFES